MRLHYAQTYQCDSCGATVTVPEPTTTRLAELPQPQDWVIDRVLVTTGTALRQTDVCPTCSQLPYGAVVEKMRAALEP